MTTNSTDTTGAATSDATNVATPAGAVGGAGASRDRTVRRVYVEKRAGEDVEAGQVLERVRELLGAHGVESVRVLQRYDVAGLDADQFARATAAFLAEPPVDVTWPDLAAAGVVARAEGSDAPETPDGSAAPDAADSSGAAAADWVLAVEPLPGQFDQRADSAAQCAQILFAAERPTVRTATVYAFTGEISATQFAAMTSHLVNPVEARVASLDLPATLEDDLGEPADVPVLTGLRDLGDDELAGYVADEGLAMDVADLAMVRDHFRAERRDPTLTELRVIDTYWSDHCRHTTFMTELERITFADPAIEAAYGNYLRTRGELGRTKPVSLMDMGTIGAKELRAVGLMPRLDESEEINACTVHIDVEVDGTREPWLLLFKNETHNHPTEIEPFGGAATCIGGAIRDPLSGRGYVHGAMRLTGSGDPRTPLEDTLPGKLPQRTIATTSAEGYSSYGNQIGLATGIVDEFYHPGYVAKHMELGAVVAAVPAAQVRREEPTPGDRVVLVGGATGRDGVGGATGSSKSHTMESLTTAGAEVQKGNAPEERKLQRFMRDPQVARRIKRCNDFGAGGVAVAVGELTDGLDIDLDAVPTKYAGIDGTELAVSESQERMALVVEAGDVEAIIALAAAENLTAVVVAEVTDTHRMRMTWRGRTIVDLTRAFLDTNGAPKQARAAVAAPGDWRTPVWTGGQARQIADAAGSDAAEAQDVEAAYHRLAGDIAIASRRGLAERFDSTVGAGTVLMPFGGTYQATPIQAMVHRILTSGTTSACSVMAWGFNPWLTEASPYHGAYLAVVESVAKLVATGADIADTHLSFQEYFERLGEDPARWGKPVAALLGALEAQRGLGIGAIGGKDSMSGSFEDIDVPPTLVSFAVTDERAEHIVPNHFTTGARRVTVLDPEASTDAALAGLPDPRSLRANFAAVTRALRSGVARAAWTPGFGGVAEGVLKMALGERLGFAYDAAVRPADVFGYRYGAFVLAWADDADDAELLGTPLGRVLDEPEIRLDDATLPLAQLTAQYDGALAGVYPVGVDQPGAIEEVREEPPAPEAVPAAPAAPGASGGARPTAMVPVFPGTNCEYDTARALEAAGLAADVFVVRNRDAQDIARSIEEFAGRLAAAQLVVIPGGFSGGDEPDGSAKLITSFFRNPQLTAGVEDLLERRDGLMLGICNGFQALIKLGLISQGRIVEQDADSPTLTVNRIGRHQSRIVRTRVVEATSPWLAATRAGEEFAVPISHGEGRVHASAEQMREFARRGQIATQYVDLSGTPTMDVDANPNGSVFAVEGMTSPDGRVLGKMGHSERVGTHLYRNVPGRYEMGLFASAARHFARH